MAKGPQVSFCNLDHNTASPGNSREMRGPIHGHTILTRPEWVTRHNVVGSRTTEVSPSTRLASVECYNWGDNPEGHVGYYADCSYLLPQKENGSGDYHL